MRIRQYFFIVFMVLLAGCSTPTAENLLELDREFSGYSENRGMKQAFLEFADDTAVLLQKHSMPVVGRQAIVKSFMNFTDTGFILTWEPLAEDIARSGDPGYTYGLYSLLNRADSTVLRGKYVTIWKRQGDGSWRFVLDGGNERI